ncbi:transmembrane 4 L6 family member 5-like [Hyla sarda]|uniref:transmembrane 4 L6 family member 5-like n=1 Tax=Hyla sarda TaxID=327740 RepID=UPI0024C25C88|nr:transmembrane 4 L6 family member 5-like [Hyla sarda]
MCTGKCAKCIGISLFPLCAVSIICNVIQLFPGWDVKAVENSSEQLTPEVLWLGGVIGGGLLVLVPAIHIQATGREGCCNNRCGMFLSIIFAAVGVVGSLYGFVASVLGMVRGPTCYFSYHNETSGTTSQQWGRPFDSELKDFSDKNYLFNKTMWDACESPKGVAEFNIILFSMVLASTAISLILCAVQMFNGLFGCLCGTCGKKE